MFDLLHIVDVETVCAFVNLKKHLEIFSETWVMPGKLHFLHNFYSLSPSAVSRSANVNDW